MDFIRKIFALILSFLQMVIFNVSYGEYVEPSAEPETPVTVVNDIKGDTTLDDSIIYASAVADKAQAYYVDGERSAYTMENEQMKLTHTLCAWGNGATLTDKDGNVYISDFDTFYTKNGIRHFFSKSSVEGRINTIRLGKYYYECHVRDYNAYRDDFKVDKAYHLFGDKLYSQFTLFAVEATTELEEFGSQVKIDADKVRAIEFKDRNGVHNDLSAVDYASIEYIAFDIEGAGVAAFIIPADGSTQLTQITLECGKYCVTQYADYTAGTGINKSDETGGYELMNVTFGCRIYTDSTHSFEGVRKAAHQERNPLEGITVSAGNSDAAYVGYEALRGTYTLRMNGLDFTYAYNNPELQLRAPISITCDDEDREIYVRSNGAVGCLEAAAILDDTGRLVPLDVEVCKNFQGDIAEHFYSLKDYQYGDCFFPLSLKAGETLDFTLLNLYQNWGTNPLKQLSSIEFHVSYYHLSTGTTESNCIAPYFVYGKDGWTLPDFRTRSGIIWSDQPQFNSVGTLKFVTYDKVALGSVPAGQVYSEYLGCEIDSVGPLYSDITNDYVSDCGSYTYSVRHVEFPQTDENRTYYELEIDFNREITFKNFKRDFDLFYFDGRYCNFEKLGYLNENNECVVTAVNNEEDVCYTLGNEAPYWTFFDATQESEANIDSHFGCNFAMIIKDSELILGGESKDVPFVVRDTSVAELTSGSLTYDLEEVTFMPGDSIKIDMILLPWGQGKEDTDANVRLVREDSALNPIKVEAFTGEVVEDSYIPTVLADSGVAEFELSGGRNNIAVKIMGFTELEQPDVYVVDEAGNELCDFASSNGYDGYQVQYEEDGTYSFTFIYSSPGPDARFRILVQQ